jgi:hypothetical protein
MLSESTNSSSGISTFIFKFAVLLFVFGVFPVTIAYVVRNYNQNLQGITNKQQAADELQNTIQDEVKVLTQEDAVSLQKINNYIAGEWVNIEVEDYKIRYEPDNSFVEYLHGKKTGYGLWRITVNHNDPSDSLSEKETVSSTPEVIDYTTNDVYERAAFRPDPLVSFYLVKSHFESGRKLEPVKFRITYITDTKMTVVDPQGKLINFVHSL